MQKSSYILAGFAIIAAIMACNLPASQPTRLDPGAVMTAAALTVQAQLPQFTATTSAPAATATFTSVPLPTLPLPTLPPPATATNSCDADQFVTDVTIPDGTVLTQGQTFTKTWRLKNVGSCSWTPSYALVFISGDSMNGPAVQALTGNVNPGQTVDISVALTAPSSNGNYTGNWGLRNASGVIFGHFYVQVKVHGSSGGGPNTVTLTSIGSEGGSVRSDGTVLVNVPNAGDTDTNVTSEAFFSFDISGIPTGATITQVVTNITSYDKLGNPFTISDGCVRAYAQNYGALNASDFYTGDPLGALARWCSDSDLTTASAQADMIAALQSRVGSSRFQFRVQFRVPKTNSNNVADMVRFGAVKLMITYTTP